MLNESRIKVYTNGETIIGSSPVENVVKCCCMQNTPTNTVVEKIKIIQTIDDDETVVMS